MTSIEVPDWVVEAIRSAVVSALNDRNENMEGYAYFSKNMGVPESEFDEVADAVIPTITAALGAWVVRAGFTNSEEMRELLAGRGGWVSGIELDGDTHTLYTLRQEKPDVLP